MDTNPLQVKSNRRMRLAVLALTLLGAYVGFTTWHEYRRTQDWIADYRENHHAHYRELIKQEVKRTLHILDAGMRAKPTEHTLRRICETLGAYRYGNNDRLFAIDCSGEREIAMFGAFHYGAIIQEVASPELYAAILSIKQKALKGGGYIEYHFNDEAEPDRRLKISYIAPMTDRGWFVGAGTYIPDIEAEVLAKAHEAHIAMAWTMAGGLFCVVAVMVALRALMKGHAELGDSEQRYRTYIRHSPYGIFVTDATGRILHVNKMAMAQTGYAREQLTEMLMLDLIVSESEARKHAEESFRGLAQTGEQKSVEHMRHKDGSPYMMTLRAMKLSENRHLIFGIDISDRLAAVEQQKRLMSELNHRVKNVLASVMSLFKQTVNQAESQEAFIQSFSARIHSMANTHNALAATQWTDMPLDELIQLSLPEFDGNPNSLVHLQGPQVMCSSKIVPPLCMTLHELATNSRKHGALSATGGTLDIQWHDETPGRLTLRWRERGGPPILQQPEPGFGISLIKGFVEYELNGVVQFTYHPDGFECVLILPSPISETIPNDIQRPMDIQSAGSLISQ